MLENFDPSRSEPDLQLYWPFSRRASTLENAKRSAAELQKEWNVIQKKRRGIAARDRLTKRGELISQKI